MARTSDAHVTGLGFRLGGFVAASICPLGGAMIAAPFIREAASFATVSPDANHRRLLPLFGRAAASDEQRRSTGGADIAPKNVQGVAILDYALDNRPSTGLGKGGRPAVSPTRQASICSAGSTTARGGRSWFLKAARLYPSQQHEDEKYDDDEAKPARGVVTPARAGLPIFHGDIAHVLDIGVYPIEIVT